MKKVVVASGKGGTGKTTIASSLAVTAAKHCKVVVADCDVDAPNLKLILGKDNMDGFDFVEVSTSEKACVGEQRCINCGRCVEACQFNAMQWDNKKKLPKVKKIYCEGCGACQLVCPAGAIEIKAVRNGRVGWGKLSPNLWLVFGELYVGESASGKIVVDVKKKALELARNINADLFIVDASAGIGCPVIASMAFMDHALIVAEPTPSSVSDMERMLMLAEHFRMEKSVVINKAGLSERWRKEIETMASRYDAEIIATIPHDMRVMNSVSRLVPLVEYEASYLPLFEKILTRLL